MYISMFLGPRVFGPTGDKVTIEASLEQALAADEAGFAAIYLGEQHHNDYEPYSDGFTAAGWLASQLKHAWIGTSVIPLVLHHPLNIIERMNLLDLLMHGRVMYGISSGQPMNGTAFGIGKMAPDQRARLFDQRLEVLLRAWAHTAESGPFEFSTDAENGVMSGRVMPASYRVPHPLFAIGTNTPAKIEQAGLVGHYVHLGPTDFEGVVALANLYRKSLADGGMGAAGIEQRMRWFLHTKMIIVGETMEEAFASASEQIAPMLRFVPWLTKEERLQDKTIRELYEEPDPGPFAPAMGMPESSAAFVQRGHIIGTPEQVAASLQAYEDAGIPHIHGRWIFSQAGIERGWRSLRLFINEVMPRVGAARIPDLTPEEIRPEFRS